MTTDADKPAPEASAPEAVTAADVPEETLMETARKFLLMDEVKDASAESKQEFLKSKGLSTAQIDELLPEDESKAIVAKSTPSTPLANAAPPPPPRPSALAPPIHTYPEYNAPLPDSPPLISQTALTTLLSTAVALPTLTYGITQHLLAPLLEQTHAARQAYQSHASRSLANLTTLLESTVSTIPPTLLAPLPPIDPAGDNYSEVDDPAELFSRDMATQTQSRSSSPMPPADFDPASPVLGATNTIKGLLAPPPSSMSLALTSSRHSPLSQLEQLTNLTRDLTILGEQETTDTRELWQVMSDCERTVERLREPKEYLGYGAFGFSVTALAKRDSEMGKVKDSIRKLKGLCVSTSNFPAGSR